MNSHTTWSTLGSRPRVWGGGAYSDTEWLPTAKRTCGAEAVNAKIYNLGVVNSFEGQREGRSTSNCEPNNDSNFFVTLFCEIHGIHSMEILQK